MEEFCEGDPQVPIRFYEVHLNATDYGGNVANSTATVVVVPTLKLGGDVPSKQFEQGRFNKKYFEQVVAKESKRYILETAAFDWEIL